jgi:uracil-DNA glycosylase
MPSIGKKQGIEGARLINCVTKAIVKPVMNSIAPSHTEDDATAQEVGAPLSLSENTPSWKTALAEERSKEYFIQIMNFLEHERRAKKVIYPPNAQVFNALTLTPLSQVRVVILGQDPYFGPGQAHGLAFSVQPGVPFPPSLQNIFKELESDLGVQRPADGCLDGWARQGVLLLNASLTVEHGKPLSHAQIGWEQFTDTVIKVVNQYRNGVVFLLWGSFAQRKRVLIDESRHVILTAPHPSPLSAHRGFLGCKHFSKTNQILMDKGTEPIVWGDVS